MDATTLLIISTIFVVAGMIKGVIGLGLPTISLALMTLVYDLPTAMLVMIAPSFITNCWQALVGESVFKLLRQQFWFFFVATLMIFAGSLVLHLESTRGLTALLGLLLIIYAGFGLTSKRLILNKKKQEVVGPIFGAVNGLLTGMTGSFVVPGVLYLQSCGMSRDLLIQSMGILFSLSTIALALSLLQFENIYAGIPSLSLSVVSAYAVIPALIGMWGGQRLRKGLSEERFRQLFFFTLVVLGVILLTETLLKIFNI